MDYKQHATSGGVFVMGFNPKLATIQLGKPMRVGRLEMEGCKEKRRGKEINSWFLREDENEEGNS